MAAALLIHGFCTDKHDFERLVPLLSSRYQRVYAPDLPAHGQRARQEKMDAQQTLDFVTACFDELAAEFGTVDVFGYSMGGALACYLSSIRQINRIILLAPAVKYLSPAFPFMRLKYFTTSAKASKQESPELFRDCEKTSTLENIRQDDRTSNKLFFGRLLPSYTPKRISQFNKIIKECNNALKPINIPTLILWGKFDQLVPASCVSHILGYCRHPHTRTIVYADISHIMLASAAYSRIIDDIFQFLEDDDPPSLTYEK